MPTYEYECKACGRRFELEQTMKDAPAGTCPHCGGRVRRLISGGSGFVIKGGSGRLGRTGGCSLESEGHTCCGRNERCGKPECGGSRE